MPVALVTGASSGIGAAFARALAAEGTDLVLVARDEQRLETTRGALIDRFGVDVELLAADLATPAGVETVSARLIAGERPVHTLVNNAGRGLYEPFGRNDLADEYNLLDLNVRAVLGLTQAALPVMTSRGEGLIVNVSSVSAFIPRAIGATYAASKAWVTSFSECLAQQVHGTGVQVCAVCPGFVHTDFHRRADVDHSELPECMWVDADVVAREGLADARAGKPVSVPGRQYKAMMGAARMVPRPLLRRILRSQKH